MIELRADSALATRVELLLDRLVGAFSKRVLRILCSLELNLVDVDGEGVFLFDLFDDDDDEQVEEGE